MVSLKIVLFDFGTQIRKLSKSMESLLCYGLTVATTARLREDQLAYLLRPTLIFGGIVFLGFLAGMRYLALSFSKLLRLGSRLTRPLLGRHVRINREEGCRQGGIRRGDMVCSEDALKHLCVNLA